MLFSWIPSVAACGRIQSGRDAAFFMSLPLGLPSALPVGPSGAFTCARVELGRQLFFEPRLSASGTTSCATCHDPERAFTDGRAIAIGDRGVRGLRNSPTLFNRAYGRLQFVDGRSSSLEAQALIPLTNPRELGTTHAAIERTLTDDRRYRAQFAAAFGTAEVSITRVASALAAFERTILDGDSPFDRATINGDTLALTRRERVGLALFVGKAACARCHEPPLFTDERFHNTGVAWRDGFYLDSGHFSVTRKTEDIASFKTPTLRSIAKTAPYMHDGSIATLDDVITFYDEGGRANPRLDPLIRPLGLSADERGALLEFLESLSGRPSQRPSRSCREFR